MPPAVLTGWVDRVMRPGTAYEFLEDDNGEGVPSGLLKANKAVVFNTSNTAAKREDTVFGDPLERIWKDCIFGLCGVRDFHPAHVPHRLRLYSGPTVRMAGGNGPDRVHRLSPRVMIPTRRNGPRRLRSEVIAPS